MCTYTQIPVGDWIVELNVPGVGAPFLGGQSAEEVSLKMLREAVSPRDWDDWTTRNAIAVRGIDPVSRDLTFHVTPHFVIIERDGRPTSIRCIYARPEERIEHGLWSKIAYPTGDMVLTLWLLCRFMPKLILDYGIEQLNQRGFAGAFNIKEVVPAPLSPSAA